MTEADPEWSTYFADPLAERIANQDKFDATYRAHGGRRFEGLWR